MDTQESMPRVYRELADWYDRRAEPSMRDRFLVLAMDASVRAGHPDEAEKLRQLLLTVNPHHMLRPFASVAEAMQTPDVQTYLRDLRMNYPSEVAQVLLRSLRANAHRLAPEVIPVAPDVPANGTHSEPLKLYDGKEAAAAPQKKQAAAMPLPFLAPAPLRSELDHAAPVPKQAAQRRQAEADAWPPIRPFDRPARRRGGWGGVVLFVLVLLLGSALTAYTVARPFVPEVVDAVKK